LEGDSCENEDGPNDKEKWDKVMYKFSEEIEE
jgi:hypothetical protein